MALARRGWIALAGLALVYAWIWVVSAHRIDGQPFAGFAPVFVTGCGDFEHFYHAARAMRDGTALHASGVHGYIYPPLIAFVFMPLAWLPVKSAALVMLVLNMAMGVACAWVAAREVARRFEIDASPTNVLVVAAVATLLVVTRLRSEFQMWQTNVPMMLLMLLALRWLDRRPQLAGLALGMAVSIKYLPLLFLPYLLLRRRFAAAAWMVAGTVGFALLPAIVSGWHSNLQDLRIALAGILGLLGVAVAGTPVANVDPITAGHSISLTSALSRWFGPDVPTRHVLAVSAALALGLVAVIAQIYRRMGRPVLRWPSAAAQQGRPYLGIVALEWTALMVLALAFSPQTNPRHTSLLLMVAVPLAAMLCLPRAGTPRWPALAAAAILLFGLLFPPNTPAFVAALSWSRSNGFTGWCMAAMLPFFFIAGLRYLAAAPDAIRADGTPVHPGAAPSVTESLPEMTAATY
ncbi:MAG TPA: glycosyltransferase family 87 protein [Albitalea sp.]|nr:glycosyltransferase family 87 protein [Albitalea sp.]